MRVVSIYQTLSDRGNPEKIMQDGPFPCERLDAWVGNGYYFWESFIDNAHWWGDKGYKSKYVICKAECDLDPEKILDLVGNTDDIMLFREWTNALQKEGLVTDETTVARILHYIKEFASSFNYEAIRVYGIDSVSPKRTRLTFRRLFNPSSVSYLDLSPAIQLCIFEKTGLNLRNFKIVHPSKYVH